MSKIPQAMFRYDGYSSDCDLGLVCWRFMGGVRVYLELNNRNSRISYPWLTSSDSTVLSCNIPPPPQTPIGTQQIEACPCPMSAEAAVGRTLVGKPGMLRVLMIIIVVVLLLITIILLIVLIIIIILIIIILIIIILIIIIPIIIILIIIILIIVTTN